MTQLSPALFLQPPGTGRVWEPKSSSLHARDQSLVSMLVDLVQTLLSQTPETTGTECETPSGLRTLSCSHRPWFEDPISEDGVPAGV